MNKKYLLTIIAVILSLTTFVNGILPVLATEDNNQYRIANQKKEDELITQDVFEITDIPWDDDDTISIKSNSSGNSTGIWYYNSGYTLAEKPYYGDYDLINQVQPGDILYEDAGGFGITGHIAIIEGINYDSQHDTYYISVIEAIGYISNNAGDGDGVCVGVLDDKRFTDRRGSIYRLTGVNNVDTQGAVRFCRSQIGKNYDLDLKKNTSSGELSWYCSELIWAAFYFLGVDLDPNNANPYVTPKEIIASNHVKKIPVHSIKAPTITGVVCPNLKPILTWTPVSQANSYNVYRALKGQAYSLIGSTTSTTFTDTTAGAGNTYCYKVTSVNGNESSFSDAITVRNCFDKPTISSSYCEYGVGNRITWDYVAWANTYSVFRASSQNGAYFFIGNSTTPSFIDTNVSDKTTYYYKVQACGSKESTALSNCIAVRYTDFKSPIIYSISTLSTSSMKVKWTNVASASKYYVYRSLNQSGPYSLVGTTDKESFTDINLTSKTIYYYKVVSGDNSKRSEMSDSYKGRTK